MKQEYEDELNVLKKYNEYLNKEGIKRLIFLWNWKDKEKEEERKEGRQYLS